MSGRERQRYMKGRASDPRAPRSAPGHGLLAAAAWRELTSPAGRSHLCRFCKVRKAQSAPRSSMEHSCCCSCCSLGGHPETGNSTSLMPPGAMWERDAVRKTWDREWRTISWGAVARVRPLTYVNFRMARTLTAHQSFRKSSTLRYVPLLLTCLFLDVRPLALRAPLGLRDLSALRWAWAPV